MGKAAFKRAVSALLAFSIIGVAAAILSITGLPQRAQYTGQYVANLGQVAPEVGALAPPIEFDLINSESLPLTSLRGQTVILNFWATWCIPCQIEMPELQVLYDSYNNAETPLTIIGINLGETPEAVAGWVNNFGLTFDIAIDQNRFIEQLYRVRGQPSTYVIGPDGYVQTIYFGPIMMETLRSDLP
ncbi:TlpA family protein disulfide reductase [Phototrophicus methaneseepsis]|uniref:TlpA family protein disulfide reductase n=1 Tax=Phototrophicus methaneseepsis TaxID=2710758 RepID=A0A7S8IBN1_9CHLR|nr:TlpA disulfide reductase family protein [Phototrophicus methaneseepsis]QPC80625.1 TlpA family protein disulfide reductase [Phototrophicus methaneseepsis]